MSIVGTNTSSAGHNYFVVTSDNSKEGASVETVGLSERGLPELAVRGIQPPFLADAAAEVVRAIAGYMLERGQRVNLGETLLLGPYLLVRLERGEPSVDGNECWDVRLVPESICPECEGGDHEIWSRRPPRGRRKSTAR